MAKNQPQQRRSQSKRKLPKIEETEFAEDRLVSKAVQRSYRQSGLTDEPLTDKDD